MFVKSLKWVAVWTVLTLACLVASHAFAESPATETVPGTPWPATDGLGRVCATAPEIGPPVKDRLVGIFYFLWHNVPSVPGHDGQGPPDVTRILTADPNALSNPNSPFWGPMGAMHYWGEPLYG